MNKGLELGHAMAEVAVANAGDDWRLLALEATRQHALRKRHFTIEDVRKANPDFPEPPDKRAWGGIARLAKKEGYIQPDSWVRAESLTVHGMVVTLWESKIYRGVE
jgi:hypothetical protein